MTGRKKSFDNITIIKALKFVGSNSIKQGDITDLHIHVNDITHAQEICTCTCRCSV